MTRSGMLLSALVASSAVVLAFAPQANALTMQECSAKYKAAQTAGSLNGQKWNDFRKAQCGSDATPAAATTDASKDASKAAAAPKPAEAPKAAAKPAAEAKPAADAKPAAAAPSGPAVFPTAVAPKYSSETAGKARMHTCVDLYNANKASNANGGMKWIEKGGGYYSECTKKLKGSA